MPFETTMSVPRLHWNSFGASAMGRRTTPEETPVAIVHDGSTTAVMMATPADLEDFGVGFSLSEGIIDGPDDVRDVEIHQVPLGIEVRLWLAHAPGERLAGRRRHLAGPTGCGLCGIESLAEAAKPIIPATDRPVEVDVEDLFVAMSTLTELQPLGRLTRAVHAAALWRKGQPLIVREDVGRHNALDKLIGAAVRGGKTGDVLLLTSRVSIEMVQKASSLGAPIVCAISAPTALAVRTAEASGMTLVGVMRSDGLEVFSHPHRIKASGDHAVAQAS